MNSPAPVFRLAASAVVLSLGLAGCDADAATTGQQSPEAQPSDVATTRHSAEESASETAGDEEVLGVVPADLALEANPQVEGVSNANVIGDLTADGLYVSVGRLETDVVFPTHSHSDDRLTTVMSGTMYLSTDATFDRDDVTAYPAGSVVFTPAGTPHTMWAQDGPVVVQEAGHGPSATDFLDPAQE